MALPNHLRKFFVKTIFEKKAVEIVGTVIKGRVYLIDFENARVIYQSVINQCITHLSHDTHH